MGVEELKKRFGELIPLLQELNALNQSIEKRHNQQAILYRNKDKSSIKEQKTGLVVGEVFVDLGILFIICILITEIVSISFEDDVLIALILWGTTMLVSCLIVVWTTIKINKFIFAKIHSKDAEQRQKLNEEFESKERELNRKREYRQELVNVVASKIDIVPVDYQYLMAIQYMYSYFCNGRADTLKEAVNLYEEELFRMRQEQRSEQLVELQAQQAYSVSKIQQAATVTAIATSVNTINNIVKK